MKGDDLKIAVCWYKEDQWERLKQNVADPDCDAEKTLNKLSANGVNVKKVLVNTEEILNWVNDHGRPLDVKARSEYAAFILNRRENRT